MGFSNHVLHIHIFRVFIATQELIQKKWTPFNSKQFFKTRHKYICSTEKNNQSTGFGKLRQRLLLLKDIFVHNVAELQMIIVML